MSFALIDEFPVDVARGRLYEHGWQSWSPVGTHRLDVTTPRPGSGDQHLMRFRPETPAPPTGAQGEGLLVIEPGTGEPTRLYAVTAASERVASIRPQLVGDRLHVTADGPVVCELVEADTPGALATFGDLFAIANDLPAPRPAPTVWCSWYQYFLEVTEADILENLADIARQDLPVDVVQLDDGWQAMVGDWLTRSDRFVSVEALAGRIREAGRRAGIWLAPFMAGADSALAREHPEWLIGDAGWNWDQRLFGLDLTHPAVQEYLREVFAQLRGWGFDYFKLDFLYAGALAGDRYQRDLSGIAAYRLGLRLIREAIGEDAYLLACGAPILPSAGQVDAMRVSPDTYHPDPAGSDRVEGLRSVTGTVERAWQHGRFWVNDPDCLVLRPASPWREQWVEVVGRHGGLRSFSDRVADLDDWGLTAARRLLGDPPPPTPFDHR